jgi:hypothetical protein
VFKLCVAVRMLLAFKRLAVGLQTVTLRTKQLPDFRTADLVSLKWLDYSGHTTSSNLGG